MFGNRFMDNNTMKLFSTIIETTISERDEQNSEELKSKKEQHFVSSEDSNTDDEIEK